MKAAAGIFLAVVLFVVLAFSVLSCGGGGGEDIPPSIPGKTYGGAGNDTGASVRQTSDGGFIIAGSTTSSGAGGRDVYLIKTNSSGNREWASTFGGIGDDYAQSVRQATDNGYIIVGSTTSSGAGGRDVYLIKTDAAGAPQWMRFFGGAGDDYGYEVQQTSDGGYIIIGTHPGADLEPDAYLIKTDDLGNLIWQKTFGDSPPNYWAEGHSVRQTSDGGYIITGTAESQNSGEEFDVYLVKTDSDGNKVWEKTFGGPGNQGGNSVVEALGGGYIVAGHSGASGNGDVYLIKTDTLGSLDWQYTFGSSGSDYGAEVERTADGGYIVTGVYGANNGDVYLIKTDSFGNAQWTRTFGSIGADEGASVEQRADGGYVVVGSTMSAGAGGSDVYFLRTDANGHAQ